MSDERTPRRSSRIAVEVPINVTVGGRLIRATATDLSEHGLFLRTQEDVIADLALIVEAALPDGPLLLIGRSRFTGKTSSGQGIGIEIFPSSEEARERWLSYVRSFAKSNR